MGGWLAAAEEAAGLFSGAPALVQAVTVAARTPTLITEARIRRRSVLRYMGKPFIACGSRITMS
jgi:hypothetical protein